ncbi:MAG: PAS domain-containing sensor histidine kinase [Deltaproteobacteria bacterium]|nr:PAS domain-containing sensor histidine kinase [Deltaproteobacteria bacterium]
MTDLLQDLSLLLELCLVAGEADDLDAFAERFIQRTVSKTCAANGLLFVRSDAVDGDAQQPEASSFVPLPAGRARFLVGAKELDGRSSGLDEAISRAHAAILPGRASAAHRSGFEVLPMQEVILQVPVKDVAVLELHARSKGVLDEHLGRVLGSLSAWLAGVIRGHGARKASTARADALERTRAAVLQLSEVLPGVPWIADERGRIELIGRGALEIFGRAPAGDIGALRDAGLDPGERHRIRQALAEALAERRREVTLEYRYARSPNAFVHLFEEIRFSYDAEGRPERTIGFVGVARDLRSAPEKATALSTDLLGVLVHEMRATLFPVIALSDLMLQTPGSVDAEWVEQVRRIGDAGRRQLELLGDLSDLSRAEGRRLRPKLGPFDLLHVAQAFRNTLGARARSLGAVLEIEARPGPVTVYTDGALLTRIAECLVAHALSSPRSGTLSLMAEVDEGQPCVRLVLAFDDPSPPSDPAAYFAPFWERGSRQQARALGLIVASRILGAIGGAMHASVNGARATLVAEIPCALPRATPVDSIAGRRLAVVYRELPATLRAALGLAAMGAEISMFASTEPPSSFTDPPDLVLLASGARVDSGLAPTEDLDVMLAALSTSDHRRISAMLGGA